VAPGINAGTTCSQHRCVAVAPLVVNIAVYYRTGRFNKNVLV
jgi:hypothetical protein